MARYDVNLSEMDKVMNKISQYGAKSETQINEYFNSEGFQRIAPHIQGLIHASGRKFKGHATSATAAAYTSVFRKETSNLTITVRSQSRYNYLYFPDDGSNTKRHAGHQEFMLRGAEQSLPQVSEDLVKRLVQAFEEA